MGSFGQDERAEMLAEKRDMPQGMYEVGPVALPDQEPQVGYSWDCARCRREVVVAEATEQLPPGWVRDGAKVLCSACNDLCACGNTATIYRGVGRYCAQCILPTNSAEDNEPCLCGDKTQWDCSRSCALSEAESDPPEGVCASCQQPYALDAHQWTFCADCWQDHSHQTPHGGREAGNSWQYDESGHRRARL